MARKARGHGSLAISHLRRVVDNLPANAVRFIRMISGVKSLGAPDSPHAALGEDRESGWGAPPFAVQERCPAEQQASFRRACLLKLCCDG